MLKTILNIVPKLSAGDLNNMERSLNGRFSKVAKKFGKGLGAALGGGGIVGAAMGVIDKVLNPLQATQEAIDRSLKNADDIVTNAKQFGGTAGELARLRAMGQASGLEDQDLYVLLSKFQGAVAQAKMDPSKPSAVANYRDDKNMVSSFFEFIQALQKLDKNAQRRAQEEVFGEKQVLKMADFLNTEDWFKLAKSVGPIGAGELDRSLNKQADLNDLKDQLAANRGLRDLMTKGAIVNAGMIKSQDERARMDLAKENADIGRYKTLADVSMSVDRIGNLLSTFTTEMAGAVTKFYDLNANVKKLSESPLWKGILKFVRVE